jgi:2-polyprenyl-6-methoxyphenol hydroxylase-like FAD-dependent oxidoreductase
VASRSRNLCAAAASTLRFLRVTRARGIAIHAMIPTLGRGANVAMRDGALLGRWLKAVTRGEVNLIDALEAYEANMLRYGFQVVREAAQIGRQRMAQNPLPESP